MIWFKRCADDPVLPPQLHKPLSFSTGPFAKYTHWKQTVMYLKDPITVCAGEEIKGSISCGPNERNPRDLDIGLSLEFEGKNSTYKATQDFRLR